MIHDMAPRSCASRQQLCLAWVHWWTPHSFPAFEVIVTVISAECTRPHLVDGLGRLPRRRIVDLLCQLLQGVPSSVSVQRLVLIWAEYIGEEVRQDAAQHQIGIRDGCVAALAVAHRARMRAGRFWPHLYWDGRSVNLPAC